MRISVYITSYNQKEFLIQAIESVLDQTLKPFEIIIVDDCSHDGSKDVIEHYVSRFPDLIKPIYHERNTGVSQTRNDALAAVRGDYVTFVDGDDRFLPTKLEREADVIRKNRDADMVFSNYYSVNENGQRIWRWIENEKPPEGDIFIQTFIRDFPKNIHFRNELVNYKSWKHVGFYDLKLRIYEDYDMKIRLTKNLRATYQNEPVIEYRRHQKGLSNMHPAEHFNALNYIYHKNYNLLNNLNEDSRKYILKKWNKHYAKLMRLAAIKEIENNPNSFSSRIVAIKYFAKSIKYGWDKKSIQLIALILLPQKNYSQFIKKSAWKDNSF